MRSQDRPVEDAVCKMVLLVRGTGPEYSGSARQLAVVAGLGVSVPMFQQPPAKTHEVRRRQIAAERAQVPN